jgi:hypothetical protein
MIFTKVILKNPNRISLFKFVILKIWWICRRKKISNFCVSKNKNWQKQIDLKQHLFLASTKKYSIGRNSPKIKTLVFELGIFQCRMVVEKTLSYQSNFISFENWSITYSPNVECSNSVSYPNDTFIIYVGYQS